MIFYYIIWYVCIYILLLLLLLFMKAKKALWSHWIAYMWLVCTWWSSAGGPCFGTILCRDDRGDGLQPARVWDLSMPRRSWRRVTTCMSFLFYAETIAAVGYNLHELPFNAETIEAVGYNLQEFPFYSVSPCWWCSRALVRSVASLILQFWGCFIQGSWNSHQRKSESSS